LSKAALSAIHEYVTSHPLPLLNHRVVISGHEGYSLIYGARFLSDGSLHVLESDRDGARPPLPPEWVERVSIKDDALTVSGGIIGTLTITVPDSLQEVLDGVEYLTGMPADVADLDSLRAWLREIGCID
jgi:hypothetical protein